PAGRRRRGGQRKMPSAQSAPGAGAAATARVSRRRRRGCPGGCLPVGRYATRVVTAPEDLPQAAASYRQNRFQVPPDAAELLLIRHGESEPASLDAPFPLVDGRSDPALAPEGRGQAGLVAARLAATGIDAIYVSTLRRTAETAAPLAARLGLVP